MAPSFSSRLGMRSPARIRRTRSLRISKGRTNNPTQKAVLNGTVIAGWLVGAQVQVTFDVISGDGGYFLRARGAGEPHMLPRHDSRDAGVCELRRNAGLAARGASAAAFAGRCIRAGGVAPPSNTFGILGCRALPSRRLARLGATRHLHHGLLAKISAGVCERDCAANLSW